MDDLLCKDAKSNAFPSHTYPTETYAYIGLR